MKCCETVWLGDNTEELSTNWYTAIVSIGLYLSSADVPSSSSINLLVSLFAGTAIEDVLFILM